jgi:hypothetical protein
MVLIKVCFIDTWPFNSLHVLTKGGAAGGTPYISKKMFRINTSKVTKTKTKTWPVLNRFQDENRADPTNNVTEC